MVHLDKGLQWVNVKQKPFRQIQAHSGIIRHIQELFRYIQAYLEPCITLTYLKLWYIENTDIFTTRSIFTTLVYSEPRYIQNAGILKILGIFRALSHTYSEALIIFTAIIIFTNYNNFRKAYRAETNTWKQFLQRQLCYVKNYGTQGGRGP